jgi:hypothetical protein
MDPQAMCDSLVEELTHGYDAEDDIAVLVARRK